jgi:transposase
MLMKHHIVLSNHDSMHSLEEAMKKTVDGAFKTRLKAIILRKRGNTPQQIAKSLLVSDRSVTEWVLRYNESRIIGLVTKPSGRKEGNPKWNAIHFEKLAKEIDKGGYWSIPRMQEWLTKHYDVNIPEQTVWYRMDQLNYSYKGARPHPTQGNREKQASFKKGASFHSWSH